MWYLFARSGPISLNQRILFNNNAFYLALEATFKGCDVLIKWLIKKARPKGPAFLICKYKNYFAITRAISSTLLE